MPALAFAVPMAGASVLQVWKPPVGVTPGVAGDATAPFALGTVSWISPALTNARVIAKFCRCAGAIGIAGTATIAADGTATAGAGAFNNETGVALVLGDYVWLTGGITPVLAADEAAADTPSRAYKANETAEEKALREAEEAEYQKAEAERASKTKAKAHA